MSSRRPSIRPYALLLLIAVASITAAPGPATAQSCLFGADKTPADRPPSNLWNQLEPDYTTLPSDTSPGSPSRESRDTTWFSTSTSPWFGTPWWESIDVQSGYAFTATNLGFQIWDVLGSTGAPQTPDRLTYQDIRLFSPVPIPGGHGWFLTRDMEADATASIAAVTGSGMGMVIVDTTNKSNPSPAYQDPGDSTTSPNKEGWEVAVTTIGNRVYGFLGAYGGTNVDGVWAYDLTAAVNLPAGVKPCIERLPTPNPQCAGVRKGRLDNERTGHVDLASGGGKHYLVASGGHPALASRWGLKIYDVSSVANGGPYPVVLSGHQGNRIDGVALWSEGSRFLLAVANWTQALGQIYDVTCIKTNSCGSLSSLLIYQFPYAGLNGTSSRIGTVQDSVDASGNPWVYFGRRVSQTSMQGLQAEWLFDVGGITANNPPSEITGGDPQNGNQGQPTMTVGGTTVGYWSYMYSCHPSGSNFYSANGGQFFGNRFYRAGNSIFDVHKLRNVAPTITASGPATGYTGQSIQFSATATNCSPTSNGWSWTPSDGGQVVSGGTTANAQIVWNAPVDDATVSATNSGCPGGTSVAHVIDILDPTPEIGSVSVSPTSGSVCTPFTFTANNVTGLPPLTTDWTIEQGGDPVPGEGGSGNPFVWDTEGVAPGSYRGRATVSGPGGSDTETSPLVTLTALQPLPSTGFAIAHQAPVLGTVQFSSPGATGATEWRWDFDGTAGGPGTFDLVTTDPLVGPNPVWTYSTIGDKFVWLEVRNCTQSGWVRSELEEVEILEIAQLVINDFRAQCPFGVCSYNTGQAITFFHDVEGDPNTYEYDWTNDGDDPFQAEQSSSTPITSHTYTAQGNYRPVLRVTRGPEVKTFTHVATISVTTGGGGPTPTISITGPTTREPGQEGTYSASQSNCTPDANGWTWGTSGGTGSSTTSQITLSWSSTGNKVITASNSGCGSASDTHTVNVSIGGGNPGPNDLVAEFTVVPGSPDVGEEVELDAGGSAGNPTGWVWDFGDGEGATGEQVSHTFDQAGTYNVKLTISKTAPGCGSFGQNLCTDVATANVAVGGGGGGGGDCVASDDTLCLMGGRFQIRSRFVHPQNGIQDAKVYDEFSADRTGMFWFFRPDNVELITKSLDGTNPDIFPSPAHWFFYGGLSNVEYWVTVTDTAVSPAKTVEYHNLPGVICGLADTSAFPTEDLPEPIQGGALAGSAITGGGMFDTTGPGVIAAGGSSGTCVPSVGRLCLLEGRYALEVDWHDQRSGDTGTGQAIPGTDRTGYFWFFRDDNIELVTKMLDPGPPFAHVWVLWGALSDVEYTIKVTDTVTQESKEYHNPPGSFCGGADTTAFDAD